ncbi:hypothetical protein [Trichothermofontia sp.]
MKTVQNLTDRWHLGAMGTTIAAILAISPAALARNYGAGIGYSVSDTSYCSTTLTAQDRHSKINIRQGAGRQFQAVHYGYAGDWVDILNYRGNPEDWLDREDSQGYTWYQVGFPASRAFGWVREDFLTMPPEECRN